MDSGLEKSDPRLAVSEIILLKWAAVATGISAKATGVVSGTTDPPLL